MLIKMVCCLIGQNRYGFENKYNGYVYKFTKYDKTEFLQLEIRCIKDSALFRKKKAIFYNRACSHWGAWSEV